MDVYYSQVFIFFIFLVKFIQYDPTIPNYSTFLNENKEYYPKQIISNIEKECLILLNYKLDTFTSYDILYFFLIHGIIHLTNLDLINKFYSLCFDILDFFILQNYILEFTNLNLSISIILISADIICSKQKENIIFLFDNVYDINAEKYFFDYYKLKK